MASETAGPGAVRFELETLQESAVLRLKGGWRLSDGIASPEELFDSGKLRSKSRTLKIDATAMTAWDSALVCFLVDLKKRCAEAGTALDLSALPEGTERLVEMALAVPEREGAKRTGSQAGFLEAVGKQILEALKGAGEMLEFLGQSLIALSKAATGKARFRAADVLQVFQECGPQALPIVTLISFLVGVILGFVGLVQLEQFGADIYVANLVAVAMVRELGGMMTGIIMAGRTGAAFAAQLGTMNVNEEIAAFRTIGIDPVDFLVLPRMLALIVAVPLLTIYANVVGMLGGSVVTAALSDVSLIQYYGQTASSVDLVDWASGLFKATIYGIIIAIAGCLRGIQCKMSAAAVGNAATSAVVTSIVMIIVAEALITVVYQVLGI